MSPPVQPTEPEPVIDVAREKRRRATWLEHDVEGSMTSVRRVEVRRLLVAAPTGLVVCCVTATLALSAYQVRYSWGWRPYADGIAAAGLGAMTAAVALQFRRSAIAVGVTIACAGLVSAYVIERLLISWSDNPVYNGRTADDVELFLQLGVLGGLIGAVAGVALRGAVRRVSLRRRR